MNPFEGLAHGPTYFVWRETEGWVGGGEGVENPGVEGARTVREAGEDEAGRAWDSQDGFL